MGMTKILEDGYYNEKQQAKTPWKDASKSINKDKGKKVDEGSRQRKEKGVQEAF